MSEETEGKQTDAQAVPGPAASGPPPSSGSPDPPLNVSTETVTPAPHVLPVPEVAETPEPEVVAPGEPVEDPRLAALLLAQATMEATLESQRTDARNSALDRLGIPAKYRKLAPEANPFTDEGRAQLEKFAADHPEISQPRAAAPPAVDMSKYKDSTLVNRDNVERSLRILRKQRTS